jgi:hypothetical protein
MLRMNVNATSYGVGSVVMTCLGRQPNNFLVFVTLHFHRLERPAQPQAAPAQGGPGDGAGAVAARAVTALASAAAAGVLHTVSRVPGLQDMVGRAACVMHL